MIRCQHCGQVNSDGSNFCRFCGLKFNGSQQIPPQEERVAYEYAPPRPYSWKTDELHPEDARQTKPINRLRSFINKPPLPTQKDMQLPSQYLAQKQQNPIAYAYNCPHCYSYMLPKVEKKISTAGWIVFAVLLLTIFPLFWIGFFIKEEVKVCSSCGLKID